MTNLVTKYVRSYIWYYLKPIEVSTNSKSLIYIYIYIHSFFLLQKKIPTKKYRNIFVFSFPPILFPLQLYQGQQLKFKYKCFIADHLTIPVSQTPSFSRYSKCIPNCNISYQYVVLIASIILVLKISTTIVHCM